MSEPYVYKSFERNDQKVRIMCLGSPFNHASDLIVEIYKNEKWERFAGFNTLSDDYAITNANEAVTRAFNYGFK